MWTTGPQYENALRLMHHYGFHYKCILFNWIKTDNKGEDYQGKGTYSKPNGEYLLIATKGNIY